MSQSVFQFFFFQAEDGIRDYKVTGVQTCALPISLGRVKMLEEPVRTNWPARRSRSTIRLRDRKSTRLNSSHLVISYAVFCLKKKKTYYRTYALAANTHSTFPDTPPCH